jgi:hypothetical protein
MYLVFKLFKIKCIIFLLIHLKYYNFSNSFILLFSAIRTDGSKSTCRTEQVIILKAYQIQISIIKKILMVLLPFCHSLTVAYFVLWNLICRLFFTFLYFIFFFQNVDGANSRSGASWPASIVSSSRASESPTSTRTGKNVGLGVSSTKKVEIDRDRYRFRVSTCQGQKRASISIGVNCRDPPSLKYNKLCCQTQS